jgi:hypothetical protein
VGVTVNLSAENPATVIERLRDETTRDGGYVAGATINGEDSDDSASAWLDLRFPAERLGDLRRLLSRLGQVNSYDERVTDVTDQHIDLAARLQSARAEEARLIALYGTLANTVDAAVQIETELARVREGIERMEAESRSLDGEIALAQVNVRVAPAASKFWKTPMTSLRAAGHKGFVACATVVMAIAIVIVSAGPTMIVLLAFGVVIWFVVRRIRRFLFAGPRRHEPT